MDRINKVGAGAGAEWLIGGFTLLRRSPLGLGLLGVVFGSLGMIANVVTQGGSIEAGLILQLVFVLLGPLLLAGMIYAAREVDEGRSASPAHLLRGIQEGKAGRLLGTLLPQIAAMAILLALLFAMIGPKELESMVLTLEKLQGQAQPDPALLASLPVGRLFAWMLIALVVGVIAGFFNFTALPEMMFNDRGVIAAMGQSFRACVRNLPALLVFFLLLVISVVALNIGALIIGAIVGAVAGPVAMQVVMQLIAMAVLMPVITGAMYIAWKQLHGSGESTPVTQVVGIEA